MSNKLKVLLVDDDPQLIKLVNSNLKSVGYVVLIAMDAPSALDIIDREMPDMIILDIMLPGIDGYEFCQRVREFTDIPIVMLTAKVEDADKVRGLQLGADDYITKPFNVEELLARIEAVLRRARTLEGANAPRVFTCGNVTVDFLQRRVTVSEREIPLTLTEYKLLTHLVSNAGRVMFHGELLTKVWGPEYANELEYLRAYIRHLRRKIEADPHNPQYILSKPGIGYIFVKSA